MPVTTHDPDNQLLHLVFGGELASLDGLTFRDTAALDIVGIFPNFAEAERAWRGKAQSSVDNALMRYVIVHLHRFLEPDMADQALLRRPPAPTR